MTTRTHARRALARRFFESLVLVAGTNTAVQAQPNVVLFFVDDMGAADWQHDARLNPTGSHVYETPNMLRLASEGVTFANAYASGPVCSPSRASIMTGQSVARHGVTDFLGAGSNASGSLVRSADNWTQNLPLGDVVLPEVLRDAGYATGTFGKWHLGQSGNPAANPFVSGFTTNIAGVSSGNPGFAGGFFAGSDGAWAGMPGLDTPGTYQPTDYLSDAISTEAAAYIRARASAGDPFFVYVPHYVVHTPIEAPAALITDYQNKINSLPPGLVSGHTNATYAAMVQKMDESLGRLLDALEDPDGDPRTDDSVRDETIIIFTADNGGLTNFGITSNRPFRGGKGSVYEGGIREPLIVSYTGNPDVPRDTVLTDALAIGHDLYPTILEWTGLPGDAAQNASMDGRSLVGVLEGGPAEERDLIWHYPHRSPQAVTNNQPVEGGAWVSAIRRGDHKLIYFYDERRFESYDLSTDPGETNDIFDPNDRWIRSMSRAMSDHLRAVDAPMPRDIGNEQPLPGPAVVTEPLLAEVNALLMPDFGQAHDFRSGVVGATGFDGVINAPLASVLDQGITTPGGLTMRNAGLTRIVAGDLSAPVLYDDVTGDFVATMRIESMEETNFHVAAIIAADPADPAGDFVWIGQQDRTGTNDFAQSRNIDNGARVGEFTENGVYPWYRLERTGGKLLASYSSDGTVWIPLVEYDRPDLPATLRIGVTQAMFSSTPRTLVIGDFQIATPCEADIAEPRGQLDGSDVLRFIGGVESEEAFADLAEPYASWDFLDMLAYLGRYDAGCP